MNKNYKYVTTSEGVTEAYKVLCRRNRLVVDTETTGLDPFTSKVHCIQIGDQYDQFVFDYVRTKDFIEPILSLLKDPAIAWVGQNIKFDYKVLKTAYDVVPRRMFDTMLAEQVITNGRHISAALDALTEKYLNLELEKDIRGTFADHPHGELLTEIQQQYAALDVMVPIPILKEQSKIIRSMQLEDVYKLECDVVKPTAEMELNGIFLDSEKWSELATKSYEKLEEARDKLDKEFYAYCPKDLFDKPIINYNSPVQLVPLLRKITKENIKNSNEQTLRKLAEDHKAVRALLEYRGAAKNCSTYGTSFLAHINKVTGRVHSSYNQLKADSGRYSSDDPNMQNIPSAPIYRACFRPEDQSKTTMYTADYSGCELRILAELSEDPEFMQIFLDGKDAHKAVAAKLTGMAYEAITKELRKPFKSVNFGR